MSINAIFADHRMLRLSLVGIGQDLKSKQKLLHPLHDGQVLLLHADTSESGDDCRLGWPPSSHL